MDIEFICQLIFYDVRAPLDIIQLQLDGSKAGTLHTQVNEMREKSMGSEGFQSGDRVSTGLPTQSLQTQSTWESRT